MGGGTELRLGKWLGRETSSGKSRVIGHSPGSAAAIRGSVGGRKSLSPQGVASKRACHGEIGTEATADWDFHDKGRQCAECGMNFSPHASP